MRLALALAAILLVPAAAAVPAEPVEGHLRMAGGVALDGRLDLQGAGILELDRAAGPAGITMNFTGLDGLVTDRTRDKVHLGLVPPSLDDNSVQPPGWANTTVSVGGPGRVENVRCGTLCQVAVIAAPDEGLLGVRGSIGSTLQPTAAERAFSSAESEQNHSSQVRYVVPAGSVEAASSRFADPEPSAAGRVTLVVVDAQFDLVSGTARRAIDARWSNETLQEVAGQPVTVRHHARSAVLTLDGARLALLPGRPFRLGFPAGAGARLDGVLSSGDASGLLAVAGARHELDHDRVLVDGTLAVRLGGTSPGLLGGAPALDADIQGKATRVEVSGASVMPWRPGVAAEAGGGLLALLGLAVLGSLFLAPLYHRLQPSDLLANANRRRIHDLIRQRPGTDVGGLVAEAGLSRVLVRHHLRMLEAHGLVHATVWRRRRTYALVGAGLGLAACELKDATRRRVASAVAHSGGATQKDLARALGLSQRLVSYHLAQLAGSSLVRTEGSNPRVYVAAEALVRALATGGAAEGDALAHGLEKEGEGTVAAAVTAPA